MEKLYRYFSAFYRLLVIGVFIYLHYQVNPAYTVGTITMYAVLLLYALIFSLMRTNKWAAYGELLVLIGLIFYYDQLSLTYLLFLPVVTFASSRAKKWDVLLFSIFLGGFVYVQSDHEWFSLFLTIGIMAALLVFNSKFSQIEVLESKLFESRRGLQEVEKNLFMQETELDNVLKMFMKSKELHEIKGEKEIITSLIESAKEFFDAYYACLYINEEGIFKKYMEIGKGDRYETRDMLSSQEVESDFIKDDSLQVVIHHNESRWGVLRVYGKTATLGEKGQKVFVSFTELDHELLLTYIDQAMIKLKEVQLLERNEFLANYDFLTKIPNRRYFLDRFEQFHAMASRGEQFSMMILDIDDFKKFNDTYGHDTGDTVLRVVAETLEEAIRDKYDVVGRLGGEEFGILLLNPNDQSFAVADRIRKMISLVPTVEQITVSIGVAYYGIDGTSWEELYNNADKALYYAKENGKNQVIEYHRI